MGADNGLGAHPLCGQIKESVAMTLQVLVRRLSASLALSGVFVVLAAVVCWVTVGDGGDAARTVHHVGGWLLAVFGIVLVTIALALSARAPTDENR